MYMMIPISMIKPNSMEKTRIKIIYYCILGYFIEFYRILFSFLFRNISRNRGEVVEKAADTKNS